MKLRMADGQWWIVCGFVCRGQLALCYCLIWAIMDSLTSPPFTGFLVSAPWGIANVACSASHALSRDVDGYHRYRHDTALLIVGTLMTPIVER